MSTAWRWPSRTSTPGRPLSRGSGRSGSTTTATPSITAAFLVSSGFGRAALAACNRTDGLWWITQTAWRSSRRAVFFLWADSGRFVLLLSGRTSLGLGEPLGRSGTRAGLEAFSWRNSSSYSASDASNCLTGPDGRLESSLSLLDIVPLLPNGGNSPVRPSQSGRSRGLGRRKKLEKKEGSN